MYRPGHHGTVMLVYAPFGGVLAALGFELLGLLGAMFVFCAAMVPDLDRYVDWVDPRGATHTVWFALAFGAVTGLVTALVGPAALGFSTAWSFAYGFALGTFVVVVHVASDALTPEGVRPFAPLSDRHFRFESEFTADPPGNYALFGIGLLALGVAFLIGGTIAG
ncbi:MAG: metal-dependent hydrolase [Halorientalis sp.]